MPSDLDAFLTFLYIVERKVISQRKIDPDYIYHIQGTLKGKQQQLHSSTDVINTSGHVSGEIFLATISRNESLHTKTSKCSNSLFPFAMNFENSRLIIPKCFFFFAKFWTSLF